MTKRNQPEARLHRAICQILKLSAFDDVLWLHPPNAGIRSGIEAGYLKSLGLLPGAADLLFWRGGKSYALEVKAAGGRLSDTQKAFRDRFIAAGGEWASVDNIDQAITVLRDWQLIKSMRQAA
jgi:hypothetical protein